MSERALKHKILPLLKNSELPEILAELRQHPPAELLNPLFSGICSSHEMTKWHAVSGMGLVVPALADQDMEAARIVMRRFMWSLNDESGGIGWGAPEAMGEILASHEKLTDEYSHILVSFMREDGFYLEYPPLQQGLMWGLGRLALARPQHLYRHDVVKYQLPYLDSSDRSVRTLAAWSLGNLKAQKARDKIAALAGQNHTIRFYDGKALQTISAQTIVAQALAKIET